MIFKKKKSQLTTRDYLGTTVTVEIDRPMGIRHPKHNFLYPINYGFIPGTISGDGEELDAYILGESRPVAKFTGVVIAYIHRLNDDDDKLIVVPEGKNFTDQEIREQTHFQEQYFTSIIIRENEKGK